MQAFSGIAAMTHMEQKAFSAAQKSLDLAKELPLSLINSDFCQSFDAAFVDENGHSVSCLRRKFYSISHIEDTLNQHILAGAKVYLYKLFELQEFDMDLEPTGKTHYHLRYGVKI